MTAPEAEPALAERAAQDPYDAYAPILHDLDHPSAPSWPAWNSTAAEPPRALVQPEFSGRVIGPTPPDGLFATNAAGEPEADRSDEPESEPQPEPESEAQPDSDSDLVAPEPATAVAQPFAARPWTDVTPTAQVFMAEPHLPALYSTAPNMPQQPLVLRIELAIVDESIRIRPSDAARRVGPPVEGDRDGETPTPRHPEFEPRTHVAPPAADDIGEHAETADMGDAPWAAEPAAPSRVEVAWSFASLDPIVATSQPVDPDPQAPFVAPWAPRPQPVQPIEATAMPVAWPDLPPQATFTDESGPAAPLAPADVWADANPTASWTLADAPSDPLADLPAATFMTPTAPPAAPASASHPTAQLAPPYVAQTEVAPALAPAMSGGSAVPAVVAELVSAPAPATLVAAPARPAANAAQSDLWFLASEPDVTAPEEPAPQTDAKPSNLVTAGLTVAMAVVVIVLVLVFIQLMTSLLR